MSTQPRESFSIREQSLLLSFARTISVMVRQECQAKKGILPQEHVREAAGAMHPDSQEQQ
jgi:hypothetical protein